MKSLIAFALVPLMVFGDDVVIENSRFRLAVGEDAAVKSLVLKATGEECEAEECQTPTIQTFGSVIELKAGGGNRTPDVIAAVGRLKDGDTLRFARGCYHLHREGSRQMPLGPSGNLAGLKNVACPLVGRKGVTVDGGGSTFVVHGGVFPFAIRDAASVTVSNMVLRAAVPSVAEFRVRECSAEGFTLAFTDASPGCVVDDGALVFDLEGVKFSSRDRKFSFHALDRLRIAYLFCGGHEEDRDALVTGFVSADAVSMEGRTVRFRYRPDAHGKCLRALPYEAGESVALLIESDRHRDQMLFEGCSDVLVRDVRIESGVGMGVVAQQCDGVRIEGLCAVPASGSRVALTADAMYVSSCRGDVGIERCHIVGGLDDPLNVHGVYTVLAAVDGSRIVVSAWKDGLRDGLFPYAKGDELEFFSWQGTNRVCRGTAVVTDDCRPVGLAKSAEIALDRRIPPEWKGLIVGNRSLAPRVAIRGNRFERTLNFRLSANGDVLIERNVYRRCRNVIHANDLTDWAGEGGPIRRLTIRDNDIEQAAGDPFDIRVPPLAPPVLEGNRIGGGYSSLLRVGENVLYDAVAEADLWRAIDSHPGAFGELTVFSQINHSVRPLSVHAHTAERIAPFLRRAEAHGLRAGINVLATLGFFEDEYSDETSGLPAAAGASGAPQRGRLCPLSSRTHDYVRALYGLYAKCRPSFVYVDDDVMMTPCYCDACIAGFAARHPELLPVAATRDDYVRIVNSTNVALRTRSREAWIEFCNERNDLVFAAVEQGVHAVDPAIGLGVMTCTSGHCGLDQSRWARTLRKSTGCELRWRPGGGMWTDYSMPDLVDKAYRMAAQARFLPSDVTCVQAEVENFPYQSLRKSAPFMAFESLFDLGVGCTGVAWNLCGFNATDPEEIAPYFDAAHGVREAAEAVSRILGRSSCRGVAYPWDAYSAAMPARVDFTRRVDVPQPYDLAAIGLPVSTEPTNACVTLLDASCALRLSDEALERALAGGVFLDVEALAVVNGRGFGGLTGFRVTGTAPRDAITRDLEHPLNASGRHLRDIRTAFGWHGPIAKIEKTAESAQYTESATSLLGVPVGFAGGVFENAKGGRVAVETMLPFTFCEGRARAIHLKRLMRWLSRDRLPSYLASFHRATVFDRGGNLLVANLATEGMVGGELAVLGGGDFDVTVIRAGRIVGRLKVAPSGKDGPYSRYRLPEIPYLGMVLVRTSAASGGDLP